MNVIINKIFIWLLLYSCIVARWEQARNGKNIE